MTPIHDGVLDKKSYAGPLVEHRINKMYAAGSLENFYFDFESVIKTLSLTINLFFFLEKNLEF